VDKFDIIGIIGEGTYGQVYKAKDKDTGESPCVALSLAYLCFVVLESGTNDHHACGMCVCYGVL
jgi:cyclin-dependent kinase 12/13